ncbi:hypothetical protein CCZ01_08780 [Helicobacter monodelphidis]|uniref:DUF2443 family protein n=1 Tax=Helicobacter sp. 15-1451 TaxID=2004995 RepID=UPI000DCD9A17|nr:DUF2443 family protein [Helicobacter sp. 15-1451]RAX56668.1 hypothetical protein CCZ01_08780 [Helicobacter sp. 15-1451]
MFDRIDEIIREIESAREEIEILLSMAKISFIDYVMLKRGEESIPNHVGKWQIQQIDMEVSRMKENIELLEKIKKEVLTW